MSEARFCENCRRVLRGPEFGDGVLLCRGCLRRAANARARELGQKDGGAPVIAWAAIGAALLAGAVWVWWAVAKLAGAD